MIDPANLLNLPATDVDFACGCGARVDQGSRYHELVHHVAVSGDRITSVTSTAECLACYLATIPATIN